MEKQMKAERDRRQAILQAEGKRESAILVAQGEKESAILKASAEKEAAILRAEADRQSAILKAQGEAEAIRAVQQALADSLAMLNEKAPNDQVIKLKAIEAMQRIADGNATKIIIPSEMQGLVGMASGVVESVKEK
jgi:regulator of protease activity HflC (stomatin/prohibitin superfamily)